MLVRLISTYLFVPRRPLDDKTLLLKIAVSTFQLRLLSNSEFIQLSSKSIRSVVWKTGTYTQLPNIKAVLYALPGQQLYKRLCRVLKMNNPLIQAIWWPRWHIPPKKCLRRFKYILIIFLLLKGLKTATLKTLMEVTVLFELGWDLEKRVFHSFVLSDSVSLRNFNKRTKASSSAVVTFLHKRLLPQKIMFKGMMSFFSPAFSLSMWRRACQMLSQYHQKIAFSHKVSIWKPISNASPCPCYCWPGSRADTGKKGVWSRSGCISSVCPEEN